MRQRILSLLSVIVVCVVAGLAWGEVKVDLKYEDFRDASNPLASLGNQWTSRLGAKPPVKGVPDGLGSKVAYFRVQLSGKRVLFLVDPADPGTLYVDSDIDLDFADEKAVKGEKIDEQSVRFGPLTVKDPKDKEGAELRFAVQAYIQQGNATHAMVVVPGGLSGTAALGGQEYAITLIDGDFNGRYGGAGAVAGPRGPQDILAIDLDRDGKIEREAFEVMPLSGIARIGGAYYDVAVEADGSAITFKASELPLGTLKVASPAVQLALTSPKGYFMLEKAEGSWSVPAGTYTIASLWLVATDDEGNHWQMQSLGLPSKLASVTIEGGKETMLSFGPPLTLKTDVTMSRGTASIRLSVTGQAGEPYLGGATKNGEQLQPPKIKIVDENGKELGSAAFSYG